MNEQIPHRVVVLNPDSKYYLLLVDKKELQGLWKWWNKVKLDRDKEGV